DLTRSYQAPEAVLPPVAYSFPRYLAKRSPRRAQAVSNARGYWGLPLTRLPGEPGLPLAAAPATLHQPRMERRARRIPAEQKAALTAAARAHSISLPVVLMTAFA